MAHNGAYSSHINRPVMSRSVTDNRLRTRGQGTHNHTINTGYLQRWMTDHKHHASGEPGLTSEGGLYDWDGHDMYADGEYFDDDVGFAYTEPVGGGHMGHRNFR